MKEFLSNLISAVFLVFLAFLVLQILITIILNMVTENEHEKEHRGGHQQVEETKEIITFY